MQYRKLSIQNIRNMLKHFFKPRLSPRMARQLAKNLILMMEIETLVTRPDSAEADKIRAKYLREINKRREIEQSTQN